MAVGKWHLKVLVGKWQLEKGRLERGVWKVAFGKWRLESGSEKEELKAILCGMKRKAI